MYIILSLQMFYNKLNIVYLGLQDQCANVILNVKAVVVLVQVNFFHTDTFLKWSEEIYFVWAWLIFSTAGTLVVIKGYPLQPTPVNHFDLCSEAREVT